MGRPHEPPDGQTLPSTPPTVDFSTETRTRLLPRTVAKRMRSLALDFLREVTLGQFVAIFAARGLYLTEIADAIADATSEIETLLGLDEAERDAAVAKIVTTTKERMRPHILPLLQIDVARRGQFTEFPTGRCEYLPTDAKTARSATCKRDKYEFLRKQRKAARQERHLQNVRVPLLMINGMKVGGCHHCRRGIGEHCVTCRRVQQDDIRIEKTPKNERPDLTAEIESEIAAENSQGDDATTVTLLAPDVEDTLRELLATVVSLPPLQLLWLIAEATRRRSFEDYLRLIVAEFNSYSPDSSGRRYSRAMILSRFKSLTLRNDAFAALRSWPKGHGGRKHKDECDEGDGTRRSRRRSRRDETGLEIENQQVEDMSRDRRLDEERSQEQTNYWFDDGDGSEL